MSGDERQPRHAAAVAWHESVAAGAPLSGTQLGERFGRSPRWGRSVIASCRVAENGSGRQESGNGQVSEGDPSLDRGFAEPVAAGTAEPAAIPLPAAAERQPDGPQVVPTAVLRVTTAAVLAVAVVAAAASFEHMARLADAVGEPRPWLLPISVDGLVVAASMALLVQRSAGQRGGWLAKLALALGLGASLAANVAAVDPTMVDPAIVRRLVAAWPPCSLAISYELLLGLRAAGRRTATP